MLVLLDSTAFVEDLSCRGTAWQLLATAQRHWGLQIYVPEVVRIEAAARHRGVVSDAENALKAWERQAGRLGIKHTGQAARDAMSSAPTIYEELLEKIVEEFNITVMQPPDVPHKVLVERAARRQRPCDANGDGYRDTLNWLTLVQLVTEHPDDELAWISNDTRGFGKTLGGEELHPSLLAELEAAGARNRVRWLPSIAALLTRLATERAPAASTGPKDLRALGDHLRGEALERFFFETVAPAVAGKALSPRLCGLPIAAQSAAVETIVGLTTPALTVDVSVGEDDSVAEFIFEAEATVSWAEPSPGADFPQTSSMMTEKRLRFSGLVTFDSYKRPQGAEVSRVETLPGDPGLEPWRLLALNDEGLNIPTPFDFSKFGITPFDLSKLGVTPIDTSKFGVTPFDFSKFGITPFDTSKLGITPFDTSKFGVTPFDFSKLGITSIDFNALNHQILDSALGLRARFLEDIARSVTGGLGQETRPAESATDGDSENPVRDDDTETPED